jgi:hypothetical protein
MLPRLGFGYEYSPARPVIMSYLEVSSKSEYIRRCEIAEFARRPRRLSFVNAKKRAVHVPQSCAFWPVGHFQVGRHSTFRTPSLSDSQAKEVREITSSIF